MFQTFVGLEIHIHLLTKTKVFCGCKSAYGDKPNTNICPVCLGYPGVLPAVNKEALKMSYMVGTALNCELSPHTLFERKNYFYPDMTKNYQISQFSDPVGVNGWFEFETDGGIKRIRIHDVHLEEDAGKMIHDGNRTLLDYNRAGTSLLEIVTEPDFSTSEEAENFLQSFQRMVRYLGVCDGNMEEGSLRCDANISINKTGKGLGTKVEIKNLNSSRFVRKALQYEYKRQAKTIKNGGKIVQETRLWIEEKQKTRSMRTKETAHDYRYFPEPDIPPFVPDEMFMQSVNDSMVELPFVRKQRLQKAYSLTEEFAVFITEDKFRADFFEAVISAGAGAGTGTGTGTGTAVTGTPAPAAIAAIAATAAKWLKGETVKQLGRRNLELSDSPLSPIRFFSLMKMLSDGTIHANIARQLLELTLDQDEDPEILLERDVLAGSDDDAEIAEIIDSVLSNNPEAAVQIQEGNTKAVGFLMGQVMKASQGSADPKTVRILLMEKLTNKK
ncbi:MAG: Asp-tRNA(Asn)/Glu-tRNA(Gln) amidotransferase subunit GatB [Spirochaetia bacterium]|nr:Asp-tRNA(Asn)/Glu-tRNA(Gln) amidotransferase subunit GatB [Spirochaetia bacterium]